MQRNPARRRDAIAAHQMSDRERTISSAQHSGPIQALLTRFRLMAPPSILIEGAAESVVM